MEHSRLPTLILKANTTHSQEITANLLVQQVQHTHTHTAQSLCANQLCDGVAIELIFPMVRRPQP